MEPVPARRLALLRRETRRRLTRASRSTTAVPLLISLTAASPVPLRITDLHTAHWALSDTSSVVVLRPRRPTMVVP
jgi:hypothetical protein